MASDEELMRAVADGDEGALADLCRRYERSLYHFLSRHTGGRDVEDLYQETWLRIVRAARRFDPHRRFSTWLFQIAVNLCRDWHRRRPPEPVAPEIVDAVPARGEGAGRRDAGIDAQRLLAALPEPQRAVLVLRFYHELPEREVAKILGVPRGTVKSRLHYALARLVALADGREP